MKLYSILFVWCYIIASNLAAQQADTNIWITNGVVNTSYIKGNKLYVGGSFDDIGPNTGYGVLVDSGSGVLISDFNKIKGVVHCVLKDSLGGFYVGGEFLKIGSYNLSGLAHFLPNGAFDAGFNYNVFGSVHCIASTEKGIAIGGKFTQVNNELRNNVFEINTMTDSITDWHPNTDSAVHTIACDTIANLIYLGGQFKSINGVLRENLARVDDTIGNVIGWPTFPNIDFNFRIDGIVNYILLDTNSSMLYVGGRFSSVNTTNQRKRLAKFNTVQNGSLENWVHQANGDVNCLVQSDSLLFIGGEFTSIDNSPKKHLAALKITTNSFVNWLPDINGSVNDICVSDSVVYFAGKFTQVNSSERKNIGAVTFPANQLLSINPHANREANCVLKLNTGFFIGGDFTSVNGVTRNNFGQINLTNGTASSLNISFNEQVMTFTEKADTLFMGGSFTSVNNNVQKGICAFSLLADTVLPFNISVFGFVKTIAFDGNQMYLGGLFSQVNTSWRSNIACFDLVSNTLTAWNPVLNGTINKIIPRYSLVYVAGYFSTINGYSRNKIAAINSLSGYATAWAPNADDGIYDICFIGNDIATAGFYNSISSTPSPYFSVLDTLSASVSNSIGLNNTANQIFYKNDTVIIGGLFSSPNNGIVCANSSYVPYQTNIQIDGSSSSFSYDGNYLFVSGNFSTMSGYYHPNTALYKFNQVMSMDETIKDGSRVVVFPNPCAEHLLVKIPKNKLAEMLTVFDIAGKVCIVSFSAVSEKQLSVNTSNLKTGIYFLKVELSDGDFVVEKFTVIN
jgi:hypothetical protein